MAAQPKASPEPENLGRLAHLVPLAELHLSDWNPYTITASRLNNLQRTILADPEYLWMRPICAQGNGTIYAGHKRWLVLKDLWDKADHAWRLAAADAGIAPGTVPAVVADVPEKLAKERAFRDNATWGDLDESLAIERMRELDAQNSDLSLLGFDESELQRLMGETGGGGDGSENEDDLESELTPPPNPVCRTGDLWVMGKHRLLCADAGDLDALKRLFESGPPTAAICDPPYGMDLHRGGSDRIDWDSNLPSAAARGRVYPKITGDGGPFDAAPIFRALADCKELFLFGAEYYIDTVPVTGRDGSWLVWDKRTPGMEDEVGSEFELIWSKKPHKRRMLRHQWVGFMAEDREEAQSRQHPSQKPTVLLRDIVEQWIDPGARVADLYAGSGSLIVACEQTGRTGLACEIEPYWCDVILARILKVAGIDPVRDEDGAKFSELLDSLTPRQHSLTM